MKNISNKITWKNITIILFIIFFLYLIFYFLLKTDTKRVETTISLDQYEIVINENTIIYNESESSGSVIIIKENDDYSLKISGESNREYEFTIEDENGKTYSFKYSFDDKENLSLREK